MTEYSGRFNVRLPTDLHDALAQEAARQGVSLNALIVALLAGGIGWGQRRSGAREASA
jgi:predicted HicB family RNase H-like nuclease